jgi:hypothetical protein
MKKTIPISLLFTALLAGMLQACKIPTYTASNTEQQISTDLPVESQNESAPLTVNSVSLPAGMPAVETDFGKMLAMLQSEKFSYIENFAIEKYDAIALMTPNTLTYTVSFPASETVYLQYGWCAQDKNTLQQNLQHIKPTFYFNDQQIPDEYITTLETKATNGWECTNAGMLLSGWQPGSYHFRVAANFDEKINDGATDYEMGDYITVYSVTVQ